ncbi:MAG TPA: hypothetical protein PKC23_02945 [Candidatus Desulfobacillus sp.]|nr:hypothetical protein [Candidatus Desulfobacillus sp.]
MDDETNDSVFIKIAAWCVGFFTFFCIYYFLLDIATDRLGLIGLIEFAHPGRDAEDGGEDGITLYGVAGSVLSIYLGVWVGRIVYSGKASGGASEENLALYKAFLVGNIVVVVLSAITQIAFRQYRGFVPRLAHLTIDVLALLGVYWSCRQWYRDLLRRIKPKQ